MSTLFLITIFLLAVGVLTFVGFCYLFFVSEVPSGSSDLLIWLSISLATLISGDVLLVLNRDYHWASIPGFAGVTFMVGMCFTNTLIRWRENQRTHHLDSIH
jgi:hypothetical protein